LELDSLHTVHPMQCFIGPHGFVYVVHPQIRTRPRLLCNAPTPEVSSSYV